MKQINCYGGAVMNKVTVKIANQEYTIVGEEKKEYLLKLAAHVDEEMEKLLQQNPKFSHSSCAILAAINITDTFYKERSEMDKPKKEYELLLKQKEALENELSAENKEMQALKRRLEDSVSEMNRIEEWKKDYEQSLAEKDKQIKEANDISNEFQNRLYRLQLELEEWKEKAK